MTAVRSPVRTSVFSFMLACSSSVGGTCPRRPRFASPKVRTRSPDEKTECSTCDDRPRDTLAPRRRRPSGRHRDRRAGMRQVVSHPLRSRRSADCQSDSPNDVPSLDARMCLGGVAELIGRRDRHHESYLSHRTAKLGEFRRTYVGVIRHNAYAPPPPWVRLDTVGIRHTPAMFYQPDRSGQHGTAGKRENCVESVRRRLLDALERTTPTSIDDGVRSELLEKSPGIRPRRNRDDARATVARRELHRERSPCARGAVDQHGLSSADLEMIVAYLH